MKQMLLTLISNTIGYTNQCEHCQKQLICRKRSQNSPNKASPNDSKTTTGTNSSLRSRQKDRALNGSEELRETWKWVFLSKIQCSRHNTYAYADFGITTLRNVKGYGKEMKMQRHLKSERPSKTQNFRAQYERTKTTPLHYYWHRNNKEFHLQISELKKHIMDVKAPQRTPKPNFSSP